MGKSPIQQFSLASNDYILNISKRKSNNGQTESIYYDTTLKFRLNYDGNNLEESKRINNTYGVKVKNLQSLNSALDMVGFKKLSKEDEELLTEYIASRGDYGRRENPENILSSGSMIFSEKGVSIFGVEDPELECESAYIENGFLDARNLKEAVNIIKELDCQPE